MSSDDDTSTTISSSSPSSTKTEYSSSAGSSHSVPPEHNYQVPPDRTELLDTARVFLSSAQIQAQSENTRREFLLKKGLSNPEIDYLLRAVPPAIPARSYPKPPRPRLPYLLASLFRVVTWFVGLSAASALFYYYLILPRLTLTRNARHHLKFHQLSLMERLRARIEEARNAQLETRTTFGLPTAPSPQTEGEGDQGPTASAPATVEASETEPTAVPATSSDKPPAPAPDPVLLPSLETLKTTIRSSAPPSSETFAFGGPSPTPQARTLQSLTSLTAYISSQMYASGGRSMNYATYGGGFGGFGGQNGQNSNPAAEEMRREIKALKGLVLNRRTFTTPLPSPPVSQMS